MHFYHSVKFRYYKAYRSGIKFTNGSPVMYCNDAIIKNKVRSEHHGPTFCDISCYMAYRNVYNRQDR